MSSVKYQVVVSGENSLYMAWQTQVFCASAWAVLGQHPLVVVHGNGAPLRDEFHALRAHGVRILEASSFTTMPRGVQYPPRNELGTLREIASLLESDLTADHILFCEPDMLFVHPIEYTSSLAVESYPYLRYREARVTAAARACGIGHLIARLDEARRVGVPYLLRLDYVRRLAPRWIDVLDRFDELRWIDIMYAFGIALELEGLDPDVTHIMTDNYLPTKPVRRLIHYCFGDDVWDKRHFRDHSPLDLPEDALRGGVPGTVRGEILRQIRHARTVFGLRPATAEPV